MSALSGKGVFESWGVGVIGGLSGLSCWLLLGAGACWKDLFAFGEKLHKRGSEVKAELKHAVSVLEAWLASHGVMSPRLKARQASVEETMPEAFGALAISLGSGLSLAQAIRYVGGHAEEPIHSEFLRASSEMSCGVPPVEALDGLVERLNAPGLELVALALKVSRKTGAPLSNLLAEAAQMAEERVELARRLDVKTSQARMSARLVSCMPLGMIAFLSLLSGDFRAGVVTVAGASSIAAALVLNLIAAGIIHRIMQVRL